MNLHINVFSDFFYECVLLSVISLLDLDLAIGFLPQIKLTCWWLNLHINVFPRLFSLFFIFVIPVDRIPQEYVLPHHLYNIFLVIIHPSQFTYRQKSEQAHFPASRLFTREAGNVRREVVWDIFKQNTSNHFSVHAGGGKWEVGSGKREALWSSSLRQQHG